MYDYYACLLQLFCSFRVLICFPCYVFQTGLCFSRLFGDVFIDKKDLSTFSNFRIMLDVLVHVIFISDRWLALHRFSIDSFLPGISDGD